MHSSTHQMYAKQGKGEHTHHAPSSLGLPLWIAPSAQTDTLAYRGWNSPMLTKMQMHTTHLPRHILVSNKWSIESLDMRLLQHQFGSIYHASKLLIIKDGVKKDISSTLARKPVLWSSIEKRMKGFNWKSRPPILPYPSYPPYTKILNTPLDACFVFLYLLVGQFSR